MSIVQLRQAYIQQTDGSSILQGIDLNIAAGEFVYLVGKTGTGKTSLIRTLHGTLPLAAGEGEVAGFPLHLLKKAKYLSCAAILVSFFKIFSYSLTAIFTKTYCLYLMLLAGKIIPPNIRAS
jgi:ABC-type phosphate/phosphonate transport system ATPase subunit